MNNNTPKNQDKKIRQIKPLDIILKILLGFGFLFLIFSLNMFVLSYLEKAESFMINMVLNVIIFRIYFKVNRRFF